MSTKQEKTKTKTTTTKACCNKADLKNLCSFVFGLEAPASLHYTQTWEEWGQQFVDMATECITDKTFPRDEAKDMVRALATFNAYPKQAGDFGLSQFVNTFVVLDDD